MESFLPKELAAAAVAGDDRALDAYLAALAGFFARGTQLGAHLGIEVTEVVAERVVMRMAWRPELQRAGGILHGGALMALADHVAGCLFNADPRVGAAGATGVTTDFHASFLSPASPGAMVRATGTVLRRGRNVTFMQVDVVDEASGKTVATCRTTYLTVPLERVASGGR